MKKIRTRMGDGSLVELTEDELKKEFEEGTQDAANRGKIPPLTQDELDHLFDIYSSPSRPVGVEMGNEVIFTYDSTCGEVQRTLTSIDRTQSLQLFERMLGADSVELGHNDYSFKAVKPVISYERNVLEQALLITTVPVLYGAMPNLGLYYRPEGPVQNPSELMAMGKIEEAREAHEEAIEYAVKDMVYVASELYESGVDAIDFDTTGSAGDPDFLAALQAVEILKEKYPGLCIEMGMSGEFILGMHGDLTYNDVRLAGLYPHQQVQLAEKAGVTIFGPVVNTNTSKTCAWNVARVVTFLKFCVKQSNIPVHANMGMGVGGLPVTPFVPIDAVSRASQAVVEITRLDGLQVGVGDILGMAATHAIASGMGGMRTAGDLVARMQMSRGMRIKEAKEYVAGKLNVSLIELSDPLVMSERREDLKLGLINPPPSYVKGIEAKFHIAELLGVEIHSLSRFKEKIGF